MTARVEPMTGCCSTLDPADGVTVARAGCALTASLSPEQYRDTLGGPIATNTLTSS